MDLLSLTQGAAGVAKVVGDRRKSLRAGAGVGGRGGGGVDDARATAAQVEGDAGIVRD